MNFVEKLMLAGLGLVLANSAKDTYQMQRTVDRPVTDLYTDLSTSRHLPGRTRVVYGKSGVVSQVVVAGDGKEAVSWQIMNSGEVVSRFSAKLIPVGGNKSRIEWEEEDITDEKARKIAEEDETSDAIDLLEGVIKEQISAARDNRPFDEAAMEAKAKGAGFEFPKPGELARKEEIKRGQGKAPHDATAQAAAEQAASEAANASADASNTAEPAIGQTAQAGDARWMALTPFRPGHSGLCRDR
jgi:hypothetical protein